MKAVATSFAQLAAIIMLMITLAITTAALAQWAGATNANAAGAVEAESVLLTDAR
jgi:hypothetical protein